MNTLFNELDIQKISKVLQVVPKHKGNNYRFEIERVDLGRKIAVEIYPEIKIGLRRGSLISVYTATSHLQLHFCTGYVISEMLGEVTFIGEERGKISGLIVEREGGCSLYANVDREILSGDFTTLGPEVMLSGIALSLTETLTPLHAHSDETRKRLSKQNEVDLKENVRRKRTPKKIKRQNRAVVEVTNSNARLRFSRRETQMAVSLVMRYEAGHQSIISVVFLGSNAMRHINRQFLRHDSVTDVISFPLEDGVGVDAELYVNLDRARTQARMYDVSFSNEVKRLLIHGTLHLCGYTDRTVVQQTLMKQREDYYLSLLDRKD
jgi:rRNA maturation RNase YbeY